MPTRLQGSFSILAVLGFAQKEFNVILGVILRSIWQLEKKQLIGTRVGNKGLWAERDRKAALGSDFNLSHPQKEVQAAAFNPPCPKTELSAAVFNPMSGLGQVKSSCF
jgi:hypothetical protein